MTRRLEGSCSRWKESDVDGTKHMLRDLKARQDVRVARKRAQDGYHLANYGSMIPYHVTQERKKEFIRAIFTKLS